MNFPEHVNMIIVFITFPPVLVFTVWHRMYPSSSAELMNSTVLLEYFNRNLERHRRQAISEFKMRTAIPPSVFPHEEGTDYISIETLLHKYFRTLLTPESKFQAGKLEAPPRLERKTRQGTFQSPQHGEGEGTFPAPVLRGRNNQQVTLRRQKHVARDV